MRNAYGIDKRDLQGLGRPTRPSLQESSLLQVEIRLDPEKFIPTL
jgi:hypothetical protein